MNITIHPLNEKTARDIVSWKYPGEYAIYNYPEWPVLVQQKRGIVNPVRREKEFRALYEKDKCIGYFRFLLHPNRWELALSIRPELCGQGIGNEVLKVILAYYNSIEEKKKLTLQVRPFNKRAIRCYEKAGFRKIEKNFGYDQTIRMRYYP